MATSDSTTKACRTCGNSYPATPDYFRRYAKYPDGLTIHCKQCLCKKAPRIAQTVDIGVVGVVGIPLTKGHIAIVDEMDSDLGSMLWKANVINGRAYASRYLRNGGRETLMYLHRAIYERVVGRQLERHELVDHEDNDPLNNRRSNLRLADYSKNGANRKMSSNNRSGYKGVIQKENRWYAIIRVQGQDIQIGIFDSPTKAHAAYCEAAKHYFGEFARFE